MKKLSLVFVLIFILSIFISLEYASDYIESRLNVLRSSYEYNMDRQIMTMTDMASHKADYIFGWFLDIEELRAVLEDGLRFDRQAAASVLETVLNGDPLLSEKVGLQNIHLLDDKGHCVLHFHLDQSKYRKVVCPGTGSADSAGGFIPNLVYSYPFEDGNGSIRFLALEFSYAESYQMIVHAMQGTPVMVFERDILQGDETRHIEDLGLQTMSLGGRWLMAGYAENVKAFQENLRHIDTEDLDLLGTVERLFLGEEPGDEGQLILMKNLSEAGGGRSFYFAQMQPADEMRQMVRMSHGGVFTLIMTILVLMLALLFLIRFQRMHKEDNRRFRMMVDYSPGWEYWQDPKGELIVTSPACEKLTGYSREEFMRDGKLIRSIVYEEDRKIFSEHLEKAEENEYSGMEALKYRIRTRGGELRWIEHSCYPVYSADGEYLGRRISNTDMSDAIEMQKALYDQDRLIESLFQQGSLGIAVLNTEGSLKRVNKRFLDIFGLGDHVEQLKKRNIFNDSMLKKNHLMQTLENVFRGGSTEYWEMEYTVNLGLMEDIEGEGHISRWIAVTAVPLKDMEGRIENVVLQISDISERKRVEEQLKKSEEMFRNLWENSGNPMQICSAEGQILNVNSSFSRVFRKPKKDLIGRNMNVIFHESRRREEWDRFQGILTSVEFPLSIEQNIQSWDSGERWYRVTHTKLDSALSGMSLLSVYTDIDESRQITEAIRSSEQKLRLLAESSSVAIVALDVDGRIEMMNSIALDRVGRTLEDVLKQKLSDLYEGEISREIRERFQLCRELGESRSYEDEIRSEGARVQWFLNTYDPIPDPAGGFSGVQLMSQDISERKRIEKETERVHRYYRDAIRNLDGIPYILNYEEDRYEFIASEASQIFMMALDEITPSLMRSRVIDVKPEDYSGRRWEDAGEYGRTFREGQLDRYQAQFSILLEDGSQRYLFDSAIGGGVG